MDALGLIREFLRERLSVEPERVVPEAELDRLGVDSLMLLELMFKFEDQFGLEIPSNRGSPRTVGEVLALIGGLCGASR
jgi:acyl carrier protein